MSMKVVVSSRAFARHAELGICMVIGSSDVDGPFSACSSPTLPDLVTPTSGIASIAR